MWIPPEEVDPVYFHCPTRKSVGYFGAVRLRDGKFIFQRATTRFNGESFLGFMKLLHSRGTHTSREMIAIVDNARYHHAKLHAPWRSEHDTTFNLDFLPPYSPKLSMIERVWKLTRRLRTHNKRFTELEEIMAAVETQLEVWGKPNETLRRLCAIS